MLNIRNMTRSDLDLAMDWAGKEGWNPGLDDGDAFFAADPGGYLVGEENGQAVSMISVVRYDDSFGFLGFYICAPEHRGQGYGWDIWQAGMAHLGQRSVGLDGVLDQQDNYKKSGFVLAHRNIRYSGQLDLDPPEDARLTPVEARMIPALQRYDRAFFPANRNQFLAKWLDPKVETRHTLALTRKGEIEGYGTIRACQEGYKIGPLFASNKADADLLFQALCAKVGGGTLILDVPETHQDSIKLAERYGLKPVFETARMYRGKKPDLPLSRIWGITTFELG